jgi:4-amino-4-deoxy-L-arabinose transferase-like glycosyltransferase
MADSLKNGHLPYTEIWDNKPPGIYFIFALSLLIFGNSVISIRIAACLAVAITCYLLYRMGFFLDAPKNRVGLLAGSFYAVFSTTNGGLASNTEIFFAPFVVLSFLILFSTIFQKINNYPVFLC